MDKKQLNRGFLIAGALFLAVLIFALLLPRMEAGGNDGGQPIVLSEILSSNRTCPAPNGKYLDFIEVENRSGSVIDLSGYMLSDSPDSIGYTFPAGTVLQPGAFAVCWCDKDAGSERYASFGISKDGKDTIYLYNGANVLVDEAHVSITNTNIPLIRSSDSGWQAGSRPTPGYANTEDGYTAWLQAMDAGSAEVVISEVLSGGSCMVLDSGGTICDWVELHNTGASEVVLDGAYLSDDPADPMKWQIPVLRLQAGERAVIRCMGDSAGAADANFALPRSGCTVTLCGIYGNLLSEVTVPLLAADHSWQKTDTGYEATDCPTPGFENSESGFAAWLQAVGAENTPVIISEIMPANRSTITNEAGQLCDWVELHNTGSVAVSLEGLMLTDDTADRGRWKLPAMELPADGRLVICCSGSAAAAGEAPFALSRSGGTVVLSGTAGQVLHQLTYPAMEPDRVWAMQEDRTYIASDLATPGYANTEEGHLDWLRSRTPIGPLVISEVMPSNSSLLPQSDGECYDWAELVNTGTIAIDLQDYSLSDDSEQPDMFRLPQKTLQPGDRILVFCSGNPALTGSAIHAPFTLSRQESWLYITGPDGRFCDYLRIYDVPYQGSVSHNGYHTNPTPGSDNGTGVAFICAAPEITTAGGVYEDVSAVEVTLSGTGTLRYTTDGSIPTAASPIYTAPLSLSATTVVRAAAFSDGKLPSDTVTATYILNEGHTLPVLSLAADPTDLFGPSGIYTQFYWDKEVPASFSLYENGEHFTIDCGVKLYGHTALKLPKKSFKVNFRGRYGQSELHYPVFGAGAPEIYDSLCIRAGQDYPNAIIREELFTSLSLDMGEHVVTQRSKYCILYVNGKYYGIYSLKEAFTELFYAQNHGVSAESVTIEQAPVGTDSEIYALTKYCYSHDMALPEHYDYVASQVDIDSLIDWIIIESYCTNGDVQQNLRYFRSTENGNRWQLAFYDLDWAFFYHNAFLHMFGPTQDWQHMGLTRNLIRNETFRQQFLERLSFHMANTLSDEHVLARIDELETLLLPEVERERARWGSSVSSWQTCVNGLRAFITDNDHLGSLVDQLRIYIGLTDTEAETYFARWDR